MVKTICKQCNGKGKSFGIFPAYSENVAPKDKKPYIQLECPNCFGSGLESVESDEWRKKGQIIKSKRIERQLTLKKASKILNVKSSILSMMERGVIEPDPNISYDFHMKVYNNKKET